MVRIPAISSANVNRLLAATTVLVSLAVATTSHAEGGGTVDPCTSASGKYVGSPSGANLLALAACHEQAGKTASAWAEYLEAATVAHHDKQRDVEASAKRRATALESRLSTLAVRVPPDADVAGLEVHRDGIALSRATWGTAAPVDPGAHHVEATAPGRLPWRRTIVVRATVPRSGPSAQSIEIGPLDEAVATTTLSSAALPDGRTSDTADYPMVPPHTGRTQRAIGLTMAGSGLVGLGLGTYFGIRTLDQSDAARRMCPSSPCADRNAIAMNDRAKTSALASTVGFAAGGGLLLLGSILFFVAPSASATASAGPLRAKTFDVAATPAFTGLRVGGDF